MYVHVKAFIFACDGVNMCLLPTQAQKHTNSYKEIHPSVLCVCVCVCVCTCVRVCARARASVCACTRGTISKKHQPSSAKEESRSFILECRIKLTYLNIFYLTFISGDFPIIEDPGRPPAALPPVGRQFAIQGHNCPHFEIPR